MPGTPGDGLAGTDEAGAGAGGGVLAEVGVAEQMDVDGAGEVEGALDRGGDEGDFVEFDHGVRVLGEVFQRSFGPAKDFAFRRKGDCV